MFYSKETGGFYDEALHGARLLNVQDPSVPDGLATVPNPDCRIPADAVEISDDNYAALLAAQTDGQVIQSNKKGEPVAAKRPEPAFAEVRAEYLGSVRAARREVLLTLPGLWMAATADGDKTAASAIIAARKALLDITDRPEVVAAKTLDELKVACQTVYDGILAALPSAIRDALGGDASSATAADES